MNTTTLKLIEMAINEDLDKNGDITSNAIFSPDEKGNFKLLSKSEGVLCGTEVFKEVFKYIDKNITVDFLYKDGNIIKSGTTIAHLNGSVINILCGERTGLNFISHLSGIATKTAQFVKSSGNKIRILDTRKTLPAYRMLQKYAVKCGGGDNHRIGLFDMVMIKDNHIDAAGSIKSAVNKVKTKWNNRFKIEVETRNLKEVEEALECNVDRIMLDNMDNDTMIKAVKLINKKAEIEASGNMTIERIAELKDSGIDYISFGELTHTVKCFDFSLKRKNNYE